jgi:transposase InsO family protein
LFGVSRQAYYQYKSRKIEREFELVIVLETVTKIRKRLKKLGVRKMLPLLKIELTKHDIQIGRDGLFTLLRENDLLVKKKKKRITTTMSFHWLHTYENLIKGLVPMRANLIWVSDITYIETKECILYLSLITDAYSKKIVGYRIAENLTAAETIKALQMAFLQRDSQTELIHHSDRGVQYCCKDYVGLLKNNNVSISMAETGNPYENAIAERVNGTIKNEMLEDYPQMSKIEAVQAVQEAICIYNDERPHSSCDNLTPSQAHGETGELKKLWKKYPYKKRVEETI